eukprot:GHVR01164304.1.p1 GENE.GHVR01164304.1~~GHVR01164304.1.p1  ORF type:complete len:114 (-),score=2.47 GHVR01164304.1:1593-1934(-)
MEDALYEHTKMKEKVNDIFPHKNIKQFSKTLWSLYSNKIPVYARFGNQIIKRNFANVLLNVGGINLDLERIRKKPLPKLEFLKSKVKNNIRTKNNLVFDSHFESGNLLYVYRN